MKVTVDQRSQRKQREYDARREEILLAAERLFLRKLLSFLGQPE